ncbi:hypothetical protein LI328DRAFT_107153 [Trichoderma asperelloides]|nr:hypothetical protein LI328DRAFT_107153 [Trichoderma asperelloides]
MWYESQEWATRSVSGVGRSAPDPTPTHRPHNMFANGCPTAVSAEWQVSTPHSCMKHCSALFVCLSLALSLSLLHDTNDVLYICRECRRAAACTATMQHAGLDPFFFSCSLLCLFLLLLLRDEKGKLAIQPGSLTASTAMQQQQQRAFATSAFPACFERFFPSSHPGWRNCCLRLKGTETAKKQAKTQKTKQGIIKSKRNMGEKLVFE